MNRYTEEACDYVLGLIETGLLTDRTTEESTVLAITHIIERLKSVDTASNERTMSFYDTIV